MPSSLGVVLKPKVYLPFSPSACSFSTGLGSPARIFALYLLWSIAPFPCSYGIHVFLLFSCAIFCEVFHLSASNGHLYYPFINISFFSSLHMAVLLWSIYFNFLYKALKSLTYNLVLDCIESCSPKWKFQHLQLGYFHLHALLWLLLFSYHTV